MNKRSSDKSKMKHQSFDHAPPKEQSTADTRTMFLLLLPAAVWLANWIVLGMIASVTAGLHVDAANINSVCLLVALLPVAPPCLIVAVIQAVRKKKGWSAFLQGLAWNVLLVAVISLIFFILVK